MFFIPTPSGVELSNDRVTKETWLVLGKCVVNVNVRSVLDQR